MKLIPKYQNAFGPILNKVKNIIYNIPGVKDKLRETELSKYFNKKTGEYDLPDVNIVAPKFNFTNPLPMDIRPLHDKTVHDSYKKTIEEINNKLYLKEALEIAEASKLGLYPMYDEDGNIEGYAPYRIALGHNDRPLSGTDPIASFIVEGIALGPLFKGVGKAGKWLWRKTLSLGVRKVTTNDGKILLQLPSHSKKMPRLLRIEPLGDNTYRVHISTWGGVTDAEKKELYDALYNTLPENAKILFPESSADYLATRGTVAGLKRLGRDPRFTPGKTKQTLMYRDKDGSIKIFEGTDFVKNPNYKAWTSEQWTAAQDAAIAKGDMAEAQRLRDLHAQVTGDYYEGYHGNHIQNSSYRNLLKMNPYSTLRTNGYLQTSGYFSSSSEKVADTYNMEGGAPTFKTYTYSNNPYIIDANGNNWQNVTFKMHPSGRKIGVSTNDIVRDVANDGVHDGVIIKNVYDAGPASLNLGGESGIADDIVGFSGRIKSADAVTYDEFGRRIPLGLRDNFNIKDLRWGIVPVPFLFNNRK